MRRVSWLAVVACAAACGAPTAELDATLTIALAQDGGLSVDSLEVGALQSDALVPARVDSQQLVARLQLRSGLPAVIIASLLAHDARGMLALRGSHSFVPLPGPNEVDLDVRTQSGRSGTLVPMFSGGHALSADVDFDIRDDATGVVATGYRTRQPLEIPDGRDVTFIATYRGSVTETRLGAAELFAAGTPLDLGAGPALPTGLTADPTHVHNLATEIEHDASYALECALVDSCSDASTPDSWLSCALAHEVLWGNVQGVEADYPFVARYVEIPDLCNDSLALRHDLTPPRFRADFAPPFLHAAEAEVELVIESDEALDASSIRLLLRGGDGTDLCDASGDGRSYSCRLTGLDSLIPAQGNHIFELSVRDPSGNELADPSGNPYLPLLTLQRLGAAAAVWVLGPRYTGAGPDAAHDYVHLGIVVKNTLGKPANLYVAALDTVDAVPARVLTVVPGPAGGPSERTLADGEVGVLWTMMAPAAGDVPPGEYRTDVQLGNAIGAFPVQVIERPVRWATDGTLRVPVNPAGGEVSFVPPVSGGRRRFPGFSYADELGEPVDFLSLRRAGSVGPRLIDVVDPDTSLRSRNRVYVDPGAELLVLAAGTLLRISHDGLITTEAVASGIGPQRVHWEPSTNSLSVAGRGGVQLLNGNPVGIATPCGGGAILSSTVLPPRLLLLVSAGGELRHCEIDPIGDPLQEALSLPLPAGCAATNIAANPVNGTIFATGPGCVVSYAVENGRIIDAVSGSSGFAAAPAHVALDPLRGVAFQTDAAACALEAHGTDPGARRGELLSIPGCQPSALAVDVSTGRAIAASVVTAATDEPQIFLYSERFSAAASPIGAGLFSPDPSVRFTDIAIDAARRIAFIGARTAANTLFTLDLDSGYQIFNAPISVGVDVLDLEVAGPQPLFLSTRQLLAGNTVTVTGVGFAGGSRDEVYVQGVRAEVLAYGRSSLTFIVPPALARLDRSMTDVWVTVRSHGRMSSRVPGQVVLHLPSPSHIISGGGNFTAACSTTCAPFALLEGPEQPLVQSAEELLWIQYFGDGASQIAATPPRSLVSLPPNRLLGVSASGWFDQSVPFVDYSVYAEPTYLVSATFAAGAKLAAHPSGTSIAVGAGGLATLYSASDLRPLALQIPLGATALDAMVFGSTGEALIVAAEGRFSGVRLDSLALRPDTGSCAPYDRLLALETAGRAGELTAVVESSASVGVQRLSESGDTLSLSCDPALALPGVATAAEVSPLGDHVALAMDDGGNSTLYLVRRDDGEVTMRLPVAGPVTALWFTPDGLELYFVSNEAFPQIYRFTLEHTAAPWRIR